MNNLCKICGRAGKESGSSFCINCLVEVGKYYDVYKQSALKKAVKMVRLKYSKNNYIKRIIDFH